MTRAQWRRRLVRDGWLHIVLLVVPVLLLGRLPPLAEQGALVSFALGLVGLFPSLGRFTAFKHQLIATEQALGSDREAQAWADLRRVRRRGLLVASLPGMSSRICWIASMRMSLSEPVINSTIISTASSWAAWASPVKKGTMQTENRRAVRKM